MDLEDIRSERKREISYDFTYIWKLKKQMDKQNKTGTSYRYREQQVVARREVGGGEGRNK